MRKTPYDHLLPHTHQIMINCESLFCNNSTRRTPAEPYMSWIWEHGIDERDWRIEASVKSTRFIFRDPKIAMLFRLTFG